MRFEVSGFPQPTRVFLRRGPRLRPDRGGAQLRVTAPPQTTLTHIPFPPWFPRASASQSTRTPVSSPPNLSAKFLEEFRVNLWVPKINIYVSWAGRRAGTVQGGDSQDPQTPPHTLLKLWRTDLWTYLTPCHTQHPVLQPLGPWLVALASPGAGVGVGEAFWEVTEPVTHFGPPPAQNSLPGLQWLAKGLGVGGKEGTKRWAIRKVHTPHR